MLQKLHQVHGKGGIYIPPKNSHETEFGIQHFAGVVHYDSKGSVKAQNLPFWCPLQGSYRVCFLISGVLEKNRDALSLDLIQLVDSSTNKFLKTVFHKELSSSSTKSSVNPRMVLTTTKSLRVSAASSFGLRQR